MSHRLRICLALVLALLLVPAALARADAAYERVAAAYAESGGHLDGCAFTPAQLEAGLAGIPPNIADVVPDLRKAIVTGIAAHLHGDCSGRQPGTPTSPGTTAGSGAVPPVTTTPAPATGAGTVPVQPGSAEPTPATAAPTTTAPATTVPGDTAAQPNAASTAGSRKHDRTPLVVALVALGALLLLALVAWGWARMRGWDPTWTMRTRHAWGEAGFRTTTTWSEFTDWLRLGR